MRNRVPNVAVAKGSVEREPWLVTSAGAAPQGAHPFATWLFFLGVVLPGDMSFLLGGAKFNPERLVIALLLIPALFLLLQKGRRFVACDLFVLLASVWMLGVSAQENRSSELSSAGAVTLELLGGYIVGRAFFFGHLAVAEFIKVLKVAVAIIVAVAMLDDMSGKLIINSFLGLNSEPEYRNGLMRAASIFPHAISYGTFCTAAGAIFLYSERRRLSQIGWVGVAFLGCFLAMSSAPMLMFIVVLSVYSYDRLMKSSPWRWKAFAAVIGAVLAFIYLTTNNPTSWIIAHLTLDPSTGYFRKATWDRAFYNIGFSPLVGFGFGDIGEGLEFFDNASVDAVWLVIALRFGVPIVVFILLANVTSFFVGFGRKTVGPTLDVYMDLMRSGFTLAVMTFVLVGLTVHYWNTMWMIWGAYIGIRASLYEHFLGTRHLSELCSAWYGPPIYVPATERRW
ncbi:succinate dehydrogenase hydrophobic anchor subunit [Bradyrhizobium sp. LB8.2]|uniref:hypothetical protein n=1 Tax=unclassified Bradyrhizobium TaxID=2631580 RepID=UPI003397DA75